MNCNKIIINGEEFFFETERKLVMEGKQWWYECKTNFGKEFVEVKKRKYPWSKSIIEKELVVLFRANIDILDERLTKIKTTEEVADRYRNYQRELERKAEIEIRKKELENCEIIDEIKL